MQPHPSHLHLNPVSGEIGLQGTFREYGGKGGYGLQAPPLRPLPNMLPWPPCAAFCSVLLQAF